MTREAFKLTILQQVGVAHPWLRLLPRVWRVKGLVRCLYSKGQMAILFNVLPSRVDEETP